MPDPWKLVLAWFAIVIATMTIAGEWVVVVFASTYVVIFGGLAYRYRKRVRPLMARLGLNNIYGFVLLCIVVTVTEESYCWALGGRIAHPVLWVDLVLVTGMWLAWFCAWYFVLSKRYAWTEKEALMTAAAIGVLYEYGMEIFSNPLGLVIAVPLAVVVYAAIFLVPMQLIDFSGEREWRWKYAVGVGLPYLMTIPVALVLYVVLGAAGVL